MTSEEETVRAMEAALVELSEDAERREALGRNARERVEREFSWESKARRILEEYERLSEGSLG